jgi:hypothetical protein
MKHAGMTEVGETVGGPSSSGEFSPGWGSTEMISNSCPNTDRKMLIKRVGEHLLPTAQAWGLGRPGPLVTAPDTGYSHADLFRHLTPGQALVTELQDLLGGGRMCGSATTHIGPGAT